jgi:transposase
MPLAFEAGEEARVDWGQAHVIENGVERTVQLFCVRLAHSKASFVYPYERATMEAFLDGHVRAFAFFGGVPRRLAYDNLKSAVTHVGKGRSHRVSLFTFLDRPEVPFDNNHAERQIRPAVTSAKTACATARNVGRPRRRSA